MNYFISGLDIATFLDLCLYQALAEHAGSIVDTLQEDLFRYKANEVEALAIPFLQAMTPILSEHDLLTESGTKSFSSRLWTTIYAYTSESHRYHRKTGHGRSLTVTNATTVESWTSF